ncbi:Protein CutA [Araneus ventricosus]|uniref:Protein CutA n=1 Tax=Araneus ventricosus TaxID=182803 RepID=A0A4Y2HJ29_ARAVE|nr:Protein CutA [Araneus ventricosus]
MKHEIQYLILMLSVLSIATRRAFSTMACSANQPFQDVFSVSYVTAPSDDVAKKLAEGLVKEKLAGCVNIIPGIHSIYEWKGEIQKDSEVLMVIKSRTSRLDELTKYVRENHPYEVCEVISTPIQHGNESYLKWLGDIVPEKKC